MSSIYNSTLGQLTQGLTHSPFGVPLKTEAEKLARYCVFTLDTTPKKIVAVALAALTILVPSFGIYKVVFALAGKVLPLTIFSYAFPATALKVIFTAAATLATVGGALYLSATPFLRSVIHQLDEEKIVQATGGYCVFERLPKFPQHLLPTGGVKDLKIDSESIPNKPVQVGVDFNGTPFLIFNGQDARKRIVYREHKDISTWKGMGYYEGRLDNVLENLRRQLENARKTVKGPIVQEIDQQLGQLAAPEKLTNDEAIGFRVSYNGQTYGFRSREALGGTAGYFKAVKGFIEADVDTYNLKQFDGISHRAMETALSYLRGETILIDEDNFFGLLQAANALGIPILTLACERKFFDLIENGDIGLDTLDKEDLTNIQALAPHVYRLLNVYGVQ